MWKVAPRLLCEVSCILKRPKCDSNVVRVLAGAAVGRVQSSAREA